MGPTPLRPLFQIRNISKMRRPRLDWERGRHRQSGNLRPLNSEENGPALTEQQFAGGICPGSRPQVRIPPNFFQVCKIDCGQTMPQLAPARPKSGELPAGNFPDSGSLFPLLHPRRAPLARTSRSSPVPADAVDLTDLLEPARAIAAALASVRPTVCRPPTTETALTLPTWTRGPPRNPERDSHRPICL